MPLPPSRILTRFPWTTERAKWRRRDSKAAELPVFFKDARHRKTLRKQCEMFCLLLAYYRRTVAVMPSSVFFFVSCLGEDISPSHIIHYMCTYLSDKALTVEYESNFSGKIVPPCALGWRHHHHHHHHHQYHQRHDMPMCIISFASNCLAFHINILLCFMKCSRCSSFIPGFP